MRMPSRPLRQSNFDMSQISEIPEQSLTTQCISPQSISPQSLSSANISSAGAPGAGRKRRLFSVVALAIGCAAFTLAALSGSRASALSAEGFNPESAQGATGDFSKFPHSNQSHSRLPCLLCHRRESNSPIPKRSGHTPCAGCHAEQFAAQSGPICTICHTSAGPGNAGVKPFPALKSFNVKFDHAQHRGAGCATCHKEQNRGVALSIPSGASAHTTCYACHASRAQSGGRDISSCGICHKPGTHRRTPATSKAYRLSFSHAKHGPRQDLNCNDCHSVRGGMPQARQVTSPAPVQHLGSARAQSCQRCHNNQRAFGGDDFSDCRRCHQGQTFRF
jgi:c(7)-type cytochrome triheme protein